MDAEMALLIYTASTPKVPKVSEVMEAQTKTCSIVVSELQPAVVNTELLLTGQIRFQSGEL